MSEEFEVTRFGFRWGPFEVERTFSDPKIGYVIRVMTDYVECQVAVSPSGQSVRPSVRRRSRSERNRRAKARAEGWTA